MNSEWEITINYYIFLSCKMSHALQNNKIKTSTFLLINWLAYVYNIVSYILWLHSLNHFPIWQWFYNIDKGKRYWFPARPTVCVAFSFLAICVWFFSRYSSFLPKTQSCALLMNWVSKLSQSEWMSVWVLVCPALEGHLSSVRSGLVPWAAGRGCGRALTWAGISGLENNSLTCFY